jgi:hypothetical protein
MSIDNETSIVLVGFVFSITNWFIKLIFETFRIVLSLYTEILTNAFYKTYFISNQPLEIKALEFIAITHHVWR